jgi:hypothetical protein
MNVPEIIWEGDLKEGVLAAITTALRKLLGRKGRILWVDLD